MVLDKLIEVLGAQLGADTDVIKPGTDIVNDLGADSLDIAEILMAVEEEWGLILTEESTANVHTVKQLADLIESLI